MANNENNNKRLKSSIEYIDALSEQYSKLNVIRLDLSYEKPYSSESTLEDVNKDLNHMFNNMRSKPSIFKDKVGYICKREYTKDKGIHIHTAFFYDGQKVKKDAFKAEQIGEYWKGLTNGKGTYHNCNRNNYKDTGIGMLDHKDSEKRKILDEKVITYLCKDEQDIALVKENENNRAFSRGIVTKKRGNVGRPRA